MASSKKANLFVVGAMRAGTTSLMKLFEKHPEIYTSPIKEPHFFVKDLPDEVYSPNRKFSIQNYFEKDYPEKLHIGHVTALEQYEKLFSLSNNERYRAEASTCYLHEPNAAAKIKQYNPDAKIIIILRDPIKRAYSHYAMNVALGRTKNSFEHTIMEELSSFRKNTLHWFSIINMSCYDAAVLRYTSNFKNVCILSLEDFSVSPEKQLQKGADFLKIKPFPVFEFEKLNESFAIQNKSVMYTLKKTGLKDQVSYLLSSRIKHKLVKLASTKKRTPESLSKNTKDELNSLFLRYSSCLKRE